MSDNYNIDLAKNIKSVLTEIGEDPQREGLIKTPERVAKSMSFLTNGYKENPSEILTSAMFAESYSQMVLAHTACSREDPHPKLSLANIILPLE